MGAEPFTPAPILKPPPEQPEQPRIAGSQNAFGHVADVMSIALNAFVHAKAVKEQKSQAQALQTVAGANALWQQAANNWQQLELEGKTQNQNDPQVQAARAALNTAWQNRTKTYQQYTFPDHDDKKHAKGIKDAIKSFAKGEFVPQAPQLFAASVIQSMGQVQDATAMVPKPPPAQTAAYQAQDRQAQDTAQSLAVGDQMRSLAEKNKWSDPATWSPDDQQKLSALQRQQASYSSITPRNATDELTQMKASVVQRWLGGDKTLTPQQIEWASGQKAQANHTGIYKTADGKEVTYTTDSNGHVVNTETLPGRASTASDKPMTQYERIQVADSARNNFQRTALQLEQQKQKDEQAAEASYEASVNGYMKTPPPNSWPSPAGTARRSRATARLPRKAASTACSFRSAARMRPSAFACKAGRRRTAIAIRPGPLPASWESTCSSRSASTAPGGGCARRTEHGVWCISGFTASTCWRSTACARPSPPCAPFAAADGRAWPIRLRSWTTFDTRKTSCIEWSSSMRPSCCSFSMGIPRRRCHEPGNVLNT